MLKKYGLIFSFLLLSFILVACGSSEDGKEYKPEFDNEVEGFSFTNQDGETVSLDDVKGDYWIANLIFTNCNTVCPPMTSNMAQLQGMLDEEGIDTRLVSFSVDPTIDDPEDLKEFGEKHGAEFDNWDFLTGYSQKDIESFASNSFQALVTKVDGEDQVTHDTSFMLISPDGEMINRFKGTQMDEVEKIVDYLKAYKN
ncbi:SCO family protein [Aquisalibacillus elongatus]|uniref:Protein SCO1/2 n=1 Tax=Aquisalibacillus elongatus TaxID=485577 RepID=A0A3N5BRE3_9BACI|nr:SCO family protein [Aquisalibacillus elongatus]RPF52288.1 protein SCO1/2 [Aquisalibacillus elongatus]